MPGAVDVHTHLDWEFGSARTVDTFGTGTMAAAFGGTTRVIDFANQSHGAEPARRASRTGTGAAPAAASTSAPT